MAPERGRVDAAKGARTDGREYDPDLLVPPKKGGRQIMAGAFVLAGLIAVVLVLFALTDPGTFRGRYVLYTVVSDAGGIRRGDPVQLRGVNIGRVKAFQLRDRNVDIQLEIEKKYRVPADSRVNLISGGLLGGTVATVLPGRARNALENGDTIPGIREAGALDALPALGQRADTILARAQLLLSTQTIANMSESAVQLRAVLSQTAALVAEDRASIRALTTSLRNTTAELEAGHPGQRIASTTARLDSLSIQLAAATTRLNASTASLQVILGRMERGEGTLGRLSADPTLYNNLNAAAQNFKDLAADMRANPKKYINLKVF